MLQPKRVKYRRPQDGRGNKGNAHRGTQLAFGSFGIKTLESKWIDSRQIEAAREFNLLQAALDIEDGLDTLRYNKADRREKVGCWAEWSEVIVKLLT